MSRRWSRRRAPRRTAEGRPGFRRYLAVALVVHLLGLVAIERWMGGAPEPEVSVRVRVGAPILPRRRHPELVPSWQAQGPLLGEAPPGAGAPSDWAADSAEPDAAWETGAATAAPPASGAPAAGRSTGGEAVGKGPWAAAAGTRSGETPAPGMASGLPEAAAGWLPPADPVELDALAHEGTVVLVDPETGRLRHAWLHLPVYTSVPLLGPPGLRSGYDGAPVGHAFELIRGGFRLPGPVPLDVQLRAYELGLPVRSDRVARRHIEGFPDLQTDPIHTFWKHPQRHLLHHKEMAAYPLISLTYIDVESTAAAGQYLLDGGFLIANGGQLAVLARELRQRLGPQGAGRLEQVTLGLQHPVFHCFFDVPELCCGRDCGQVCPPVCPVSGLQLDGRLVAVVSPPFQSDLPCPVNRLHVNVLAWALTQPSPMGGRYLASGSGSVTDGEAKPAPTSSAPRTSGR